MKMMPVPFGLRRKGETLDKRLFGLQVGDHFVHGYIIIADGRGLSITRYPPMLQFDNKGRLMGFCTPGYGKWMTKSQLVRMIFDLHGTQMYSKSIYWPFVSRPGGILQELRSRWCFSYIFCRFEKIFPI
jgi:hypothetical protein